MKSEHLVSGAYQVDFNIDFDQNFRSQKRTKFFQVHQYEEASQGVSAWDAPLLMLTINRDRLIAQPCLEEKSGSNAQGNIDLGLTRSEMRGVAFGLGFELTDGGGMIEITLEINKDDIMRCFNFHAFQRPQNKQLKIKFGLYRHLLPAEPEELRAHDKCTFKSMKVSGGAISIP